MSASVARTASSRVLPGAALVLGGLAGLVFLLALAGFTYQRIGETLDLAAFPAPGEFYDVGDVSLHMSCSGTGVQTVLFSSGMGNPAASWEPLRRLLEADFRVCSYDRDGLGWSRDSGGPRDATLATDRLARLMDAAGLKGPVILVGHSYGALVGRVFAAAYPQRVSALVLLDSSHEDMGERFPPIAQKGFKDLLAGFKLAPWLNRFGLGRLTGLFEPAIDGLEGRDRAQALALLNTVSHMQGTAAEASGWERSAVPARALRTKGFGDLPLDVFVAGAWPEEMMPSWLAMQRELAGLSSNSRIFLFEEANHPQVGMDRRFIGQVADAVRDRAAALKADAP